MFNFRYKPVDPATQPLSAEDSIPEYMNVLGMIFSMCGLMMRVSRYIPICMELFHIEL